MRTPVVLVAGHGDTDRVCRTLMSDPGTVVVRHAFDGQVVRRSIANLQHGVVISAELALELVNGCACCTTRDDLLPLLRRLHRRDDVTRIVVALATDLEPEPICWAINRVPVSPGPQCAPGPAARDVDIAAVVTTIDTTRWLDDALGCDELADGRTVAQVAVGQAEYADLLVLDAPDHDILAVLRRLAPTARLTVGVDDLERGLRQLHPAARRGGERGVHDPLLAGQPPLDPEGPVMLMEFTGTRPFHPQRLHSAVDVLLDGGVVRTRGRMFIAHRLDDVMTIDSAGGGLLIESAGRWIAAMTTSELAYVDPQRRALASARWDDRFGDRHTAMTVLVYGTSPETITTAFTEAMLTDDELARPEDWAHYPDPFEQDCTSHDADFTVIGDEDNARPAHDRGDSR